MVLAWNWWAVPGAVALLLAWAMAAIVYAAGPSRSTNRRLALVLWLEGTFVGGSAGAIFFLTRPEDAFAASMVGVACLAAVPFLYPLFLAASLDAPIVRPFRHKGAVVGLSALALAAAAWVVLDPMRFATPPYRPSFAPWNLQFTPFGTILAQLDGLAGIFGLVAAVWAWSRTARGTASRRKATIFAIAFGVRDVFAGVFQLFWATLRPIPFWGDFVYNPLQGFVYVAFILILGYGVLSTQLFDIDLRIKWTIKRGTLAAAFLAAFFAVSEGAATFFGETTGSTYLGIGAAALLLFAIAPLQRAADRVANAAMPTVHDTPEYLAFRKHEVYRAALEGAMQDGEVSERERAVLARLRVSLGIDAQVAREMERNRGALPDADAA